MSTDNLAKQVPELPIIFSISIRFTNTTILQE